MNSIILIVLGVLLTMVQPARAVEVPSREWCKNQLAEQAAETPTELECIKRYGDKIAGTALQPKRGAIDCAAIEQQKKETLSGVSKQTPIPSVVRNCQTLITRRAKLLIAGQSPSPLALLKGGMVDRLPTWLDHEGVQRGRMISQWRS